MRRSCRWLHCIVAESCVIRLIMYSFYDHRPECNLHIYLTMWRKRKRNPILHFMYISSTQTIFDCLMCDLNIHSVIPVIYYMKYETRLLIKTIHSSSTMVNPLRLLVHVPISIHTRGCGCTGWCGLSVLSSYLSGQDIPNDKYVALKCCWSESMMMTISVNQLLKCLH